VRAVVRQNGVDFVRHGHNQSFQEIGGDGTRCLLIATMKRRAREMRDGGLKRIEAIVER
jgi:hypothetical protein